MGRELVGGSSTQAVESPTPIEVLLLDATVLGLEVREERVDPAADVRTTRHVLVLVDRTPELLVGVGTPGRLGDRLQYGQQVGEVRPQVCERARQLMGMVVQFGPVGGVAFQSDLRDTAASEPLELVVRAGGVHQGNQQRRLVLDGRVREPRQEQVHGAVADLGCERVPDQVDRCHPVGRRVVAQTVVADLDGLLRLGRVREQPGALRRVLSDVFGHLVDDEVPQGVRTQAERRVGREGLVQRLDAQTDGRHVVLRLVAAAFAHDIQRVAAAVVETLRCTQCLVEERSVVGQVGLDRLGLGGRE